MARIISTTVTTGVTLVPGDNPVTISPSGYVSGPDGIDGAAGTSFTITNQSTVIGTVKYGVSLGQGGTVTNAAGALITGPNVGVWMGTGGATTGSVVNYGSVTGTGPAGYAVYLAGVGQLSNAATGVLLGASGIRIAGTNGVVENLGQITGTNASPPGYGVYLRNSGTVINGQGGAGTSTATIEGYTGVALKSNPITLPGAVYNYGTIIADGAQYAAVTVAGGGLMINGGSGATGALLMGGRYGAYFGLAATVTNFATIEVTGAVAGDVGVSLNEGPETLNNLGSAANISGYVGVSIGYGTLTNSGTIASTLGTGGTAVNFISFGKLIVDPGGVFIGTVVGGANNPNTIELSGAIASTINSVGSSFTSFGTVVVDPGAIWTMAGPTSINDTAATGMVTVGTGAALDITGALSTGDAFVLNGGTLEIAGAVAAASSFDLSGGTADLLQLAAVTGTSFSNAIAGFGPRDTIALPGVTFESGGIVTGGGGTLKVPLQNGGTFTFSSFGTIGTPSFQVGSNTLVDLACFAAGTRIRTERGEVAVQALRVGDRAVLADGRTEPVIWIGHRTVDCVHHPDPASAWPVRILAGALGTGLPARDLVLSPEHALFLNDVMIPVRVLINGSSIVQQRDDRVTYYHVELRVHDVLLAEGVATESYLDTGNRDCFAGGAVTSLFPNFGLLAWEVSGCAPLMVAGPEVAAARAAIDARAAIVIAEARHGTA
jgi:hypothetical protein